MRQLDRPLAAVLVAGVLAAAGPAAAQQTDSAELARLRRQIEALSMEVEAMRLGADVAVAADSSAYGLGPAAAKIYRTRQGVSVGGYGEFLYENYAAEREDAAASSQRDQFDALRAIVYVGYKFSDRWLFNSELEFEHASTGQGGEASVEFAYLDYLATPGLGVRAGMVLLPMGFVNELHEPPVFLGTTRPLSETVILPSTWRDNGVGVFGDLADVSYRAYVVGGLDAVGGGSSRAAGFSAAGLRGGRQKGARSIFERPALVARLDYSPRALIPGLLVGASAYLGDSGQDFRTGDDTVLEVPTTIMEGHGQFQAFGLDLRALYVRATLDDVAALNAARSLTGEASVGEELTGWYLQGGYDVLRPLGTSHQLIPYIRHERVNTQAAVPTEFAANPATDRTITVLGAQWKPLTNIVLKADYQLHGNQAETGVNQFNVALGYIF